MRVSIIIVSLFAFVGCHKSDKAKLAYVQNSCELKEEELGWNNPILIGGSDFGNLLRVCVLTKNEELLYALSDSLTKSFYSPQSLMSNMSVLGWGFQMKLKSKPANGTLVYTANVNATERCFQIQFSIESDTVRFNYDQLRKSLTTLNNL